MSNGRRKVRLCELCTLRAGSAFKPKYQGRLSGEFPFIKVSDMNRPANRRWIQDAANWVSGEDAGEMKARPFPEGTIVFAKIGEALRANRVRLLTRPTIIDNNMMGAIPNAELIRPGFLAALLEDDRLERYANGTALPYLRQGVLNEIEYPVPSLDVQDEILCVTDGLERLIENNRRRVEILEETARLIYREWFVHFRFPGHEGVELIDSDLGPIPEDWEALPLSELVTTQYGYTESAQDEPVGPRYLRGMDMNKTSFIDWSAVPYCPIAERDRQKFKVDVGDVFVIRMADPGKIGICEREVDAVFASYLVRLKPIDSRLLPYYLFFTLNDDRYQGWVTGASTGATRKSVSAKVMTEPPVLLPPQHLQTKFVDTVAPIRGLLTNLLEQNGVLTEARDLLLPRLISGELDVSGLDLDLEPVA